MEFIFVMESEDDPAFAVFDSINISRPFGPHWIR